MEVPPLLRALLKHTALSAAVKAQELVGGGGQWQQQDERLRMHTAYAAYGGDPTCIPPLSLGKGIPQRTLPPPKRTRTALSFSKKQQQQQQPPPPQPMPQYGPSPTDPSTHPVWPQHMPQQLLPPHLPFHPQHGSQPHPFQTPPGHFQQQQQQHGGNGGAFQQSTVFMWEVMNLVMMRSVLTSTLGTMHNQMAGAANQLVLQAVTPAASLAQGLGGFGFGGLGQQQQQQAGGGGAAATIAALQAHLPAAQQQKQQKRKGQEGKGGTGGGNAMATMALMQQLMQQQQVDEPKGQPLHKSKSDGGQLAKQDKLVRGVCMLELVRILPGMCLHALRALTHLEPKNRYPLITAHSRIMLDLVPSLLTIAEPYPRSSFQPILNPGIIHSCP